MHACSASDRPDVVTGGYGSRLSGGDNGQLAGLAVIGGFRERVANPN